MPQPNPHRRRVNAPYFGADKVALNQTAVFWLGQETLGTQYGDIRVGYNDREILVNANVMDRYLWYNSKIFGPQDLTRYDSVSLYLDQSGNRSLILDTSALRLDTQFTWYERDRDRWQATYQAEQGTWTLLTNGFTSEATWRGNEPNSVRENRGWMVTYHIPFSTFQLDGPPAPGRVCRPSPHRRPGWSCRR